MLDKYEHFKKVSKAEGCSFYDAEDRTTMQSVLMKRLQQRCSWDELLNNRNLQYLSKAKFAPKMVEIFKKKSYYFIVFEKPSGAPLSQPDQVGKFSIQRFYPIFFQLVENCMKIKEQVPQMYILPEWVFMNRNSCKIAHFEPFIPNDSDQVGGKHVFMYNLEKSRMINSPKQMNDSDVFSFERKQSLMFNLGTIAYQFITGQKATSAETEEEYREQVLDLELNAQKRILKLTNDEKLSELIAKMLKQDPFDCPTLVEVFNFMKRKNKQYQPKSNNNPTLQLQLEKIKLTDKFRDVKKRKFSRPCCKTVENQEVQVQIEKKGNLTVAAYMRKSQQFGSRSFLPQISSNRHRYKSKQPKASKPIMLRSQGDFRLKGF